TEAAWRLHGSHGRQATLTLVIGGERRNVDVGHAIAVGHEKRRVLGHVLPNPLEPTAGHGVLARVHQGHTPGFGRGVVDFYGVCFEVERHVRAMQRVVCEVFLNHVALIAEADDEVVDAEVRVGFHDVPE